MVDLLKVTLKDVALAAGVSVSTVSRVLNGNRENPAGAETMNKIWDAVKQLGYVPNQSAKNLVKGTSDSDLGKGKIGVLYTSTIDVKTDPFFSCIGIGIQEELRRQGYEMAFALSTYHLDFGDVYNYISSHPAEGLILTGRFGEDILDMIQNHFNHIVYAGANAVNKGFDEVICDGYSGAVTAIKHLLSQGFDTIGYVGFCQEMEEKVNLVNEHRFRAYTEIMSDAYNSDLVIHTRLYTTDAYNAMNQWLDKPQRTMIPKAFYCANDATAFGVMKALQEHGLRIPEDVAIIGLDDVEMASFVTPTLSTVSIPRKSLGIEAVKLLVDKIGSNRNYAKRVDLPFDLKIRESSSLLSE